MEHKIQEHPKIVGDRSTAMVLARLLEHYETVLLPFGENQRYDLLIETEDRFLRIRWARDYELTGPIDQRPGIVPLSNFEPPPDPLAGEAAVPYLIMTRRAVG